MPDNSGCLGALEEIVTRGQVGQIESAVADVVGYVVVQKGVVVHANQTAATLLGDDDLIGKPLSNFLPPEVVPHHDQWVEKWRQSGAETREMGTREGRKGLPYTITVAPANWNSDVAELAVMLPTKIDSPKPSK